MPAVSGWGKDIRLISCAAQPGNLARRHPVTNQNDTAVTNQKTSQGQIKETSQNKSKRYHKDKSKAITGTNKKRHYSDKSICLT